MSPELHRLLLEPIECPREVREWHAVGGWLLGTLAPPRSMCVTDDRLQWVLAAIMGVHSASKQWPIDLQHVAASLRHLGVYEEIGGTPLLLELISSWDERVTLGEDLGELLVRTIVADVATREEIRAQDRVVAALEQEHEARTRAEAALSAALSKLAVPRC